MSGAAYYNEIDPFAAAWLRNLVAAGHIAPGEVDERDIRDVSPDDLRGFTQCHFFAGIGGWSYALRLAGWSDDRPVWTGSCPCQPFSSAARGRATGFGSEKDLWPFCSRLIEIGRPPIFFGEQVTGARTWLDRTLDDMEAMGYSCGAAILSSLGVGADHLRPRLYFTGYSDGDGESGLCVDAKVARLPRTGRESGGMVSPDGLPPRMAVLGAFGNAIDPRVAASFVAATLDVLP